MHCKINTHLYNFFQNSNKKGRQLYISVAIINKGSNNL